MKKIWKGQLKCPIVLGFDLDGVSGVINRDPTSRNLPSLMSMRDYGPLIATPRILDLLDQHQIKASFYIPGFIAETNIDLVKTIANKGHEVGHHGYMHEPPATLTELEESNILDQGTEILENITGTNREAKGFEIACAQLCGNSHYRMRGYATIDTEEQYNAWLVEQAKYLLDDDDDDW